MRLTSLTSILLLASFTAAHQIKMKQNPAAYEKKMLQKSTAVLESMYSPTASVLAIPNETFSVVKQFSENGWKDHGQAVQNGDFGKVMTAIQSGVDLDAGIPLMEVHDQVTALMLAVHSGDVRMAYFLLANQANPNVITLAHSLSALHLAAAAPNASAELCSVLLMSGANPMCLNGNHLSPLFVAAANPNGQKAFEMLKACSSISKEHLTAAIANDDTEEIIRQVLFGDCRYRGEQKLLFQLLGKFHAQGLQHNDAKWVLLLSQMLIEKFPMCINECDVLGRSALHYASACDLTGEIIKLLINNGASPSIKDAAKKRPVQYLPATHPNYDQLVSLYSAATPSQALAMLLEVKQNLNAFLSIVPQDILENGVWPYFQYNYSHAGDSDSESEDEEMKPVGTPLRIC